MRRPVLDEKHVQTQIRAALITVGAKPYTIGRPPRRDAAHKGTGQTPGIPDLLVHLPEAPLPLPDQRSDTAGLSVLRAGVWTMGAHQLWIEVKAKGGRLSPEQASFRDFCILAGIPHVVGGLDEVYAYLLAHGYVREAGVPHYRLPKAVGA